MHSQSILKVYPRCIIYPMRCRCSVLWLLGVGHDVTQGWVYHRMNTYGSRLNHIVRLNTLYLETGVYIRPVCLFIATYLGDSQTCYKRACLVGKRKLINWQRVRARSHLHSGCRRSSVYIASSRILWIITKYALYLLSLIITLCYIYLDSLYFINLC
jgi:hypothetical protein